MPAEYFTIARVRYVPDGQGGADRDDDFFPTRYATLDEAVAVIRTLPEQNRYIVDKTPRHEMFPAYKGWGGPDTKNEYPHNPKVAA